MANTFAVWNTRAAGGALTTAVPSTAGTLGKNDFLNLLAAQLRQQNPLEPVDNSEFMAQTAQFNTLEELQKMNEMLTSVLSMNGLSQASTLIGRYVTALGEGNTPIQGVVKEVTMQEGQPMLLVDDIVVPLGSILIVGGAPAA